MFAMEAKRAPVLPVSLLQGLKPFETVTIKGIDYNTFRVTKSNIGFLRNEIVHPFEQPLRYRPIPTALQVRHNVSLRGEVTTASTPGQNGSIIGVSSQELRKVIIEEERMNASVSLLRSVAQSRQKEEIGGTMARLQIVRHQPVVVLGRTGSWRIIRMLEEIPYVEEIVPVHRRMDKRSIQAMKTGFYPAEFNEIERIDKDDSDTITGICRNIYSPDSAESRKPPLDNPEGMRVYRQMEESGWKPNDAIRYAAWINRELLQELILAGEAIPELKSKALSPARKFVEKIKSIIRLN
ncbi:MAG: hypothetical protein ACD_38C00020G0001 [uncultured bacterium]|uniref:Uncharacterized protein n=1 Tax=Candidatus Daviesbacteria bacterium GW2011_GWC2_40_12 TaxID=1618431 RepID=A0A0G0QQ50_9BACT|nr:MAG: hypothetical protein ACD_38C00020G0001 [uncultured bacterium]KKQ84209.1 MAG: hypothetical protein UT04_C0019G0005 [Candidatus Daviesbacteria bacterium GW2011_GWF2_38_7]KKR15847.1 MAG: hypothetical protein UT45_C0012G0007 [Candidatus Daviesbacteria bacterium GW2011_GWA2_39_33]KKR23639.1 MAG: hypothetical protein UT54_C0042G0008 [Candidatus Daviesbacteria bacterium GW2011_GWB1_39_5]KKR42564.1 MAG: hypothetical protein UT77_C0001G0015 [Candidatus Daviesbacteria bacterium GW2011_GWC2_40_12]